MPRTTSITCLLSALLACSPAAIGETPDPFDSHFHDATLRVDFYHSGDATEETITFDVLIQQGQWAGRRQKLVDDPSLGTYRVTLEDQASGVLLFSADFDSYFGEYRTTESAKDGVKRTYHESVLVPKPQRPAVIRVFVRRVGEPTVELASRTIDPEEHTISREPPERDVSVFEETVGGELRSSLDIAIVGEGYTRDEIAVFQQDLKRFTTVLMSYEPYASMRHQISVRGVIKPSAESGCDEPGRGLWRDTAVGGSFNSLGSPRYLLTEDNRALRDIAANVPYDTLVLMVNHSRYGGGGLYGTYCVFTAHNHWSEYLLVHEFGHSFVGLADEYYTPAVSYTDFYPPGHEPSARNITALRDPTQLKWKDLVADSTPLPTPWQKDALEAIDVPFQKRRREFDRKIAEAHRSGATVDEIRQLEDEKQRMMISTENRISALLSRERFAGHVGAFEGAGYVPTGLYRPMADCLMFTRTSARFCRVCERAIADAIRRETQ